MWKLFWDLLWDYGLLVGVALLAGWWLFNTFKNYLLKKAAKLFKIKVQNELEFHEFFLNINHFLSNDLKTIEIIEHSPVRQEMMRDVVELELMQFNTIFKEFIFLELDTWAVDRWVAEVTGALNRVNYNLYTEAKNKEIPEIVIVKYLKWRATLIDMTYQFVLNLSKSKVYASNITRTETLLIFLNLITHTIISDAEKTLKELNGDISGKSYNGRIIEVCSI